MSIPVPMATYQSQQRQSLDQNQKTVARRLLETVENLQAINAFVQGISAGPPDALEAEPYLYTADEAYAIRLWAQHAAAYAAIFEAGGALSAGDATALEELTRRSAGSLVLVNQGV